MNTATIIAIAAILLAGPLYSGARAAAVWIAARIPKAKMPSMAGIFTAKAELEWWKIAAICLVLLVGRGVSLPAWPADWKLPSLPSIIAPATPPGKPLIVMLYEADHGPLPPYAMGAANELTAAGREVRMVDDDTLDGTGETPDWLKPALEPGRAIMGGTDGKDDALLLLGGGKVTKSMKLPATKELILEAAK